MPPIAMRNPLRIGPGATRQILLLLRPQFSLETAPGYRSVCRLAGRNPFADRSMDHTRSPLGQRMPKCPRPFSSCSPAATRRSRGGPRTSSLSAGRRTSLSTDRAHASGTALRMPCADAGFWSPLPAVGVPEGVPRRTTRSRSSSRRLTSFGALASPTCLQLAPTSPGPRRPVVRDPRTPLCRTRCPRSPNPPPRPRSG